MKIEAEPGVSLIASRILARRELPLHTVSYQKMESLELYTESLEPRLIAATSAAVPPPPRALPIITNSKIPPPHLFHIRNHVPLTISRDGSWTSAVGHQTTQQVCAKIKPRCQTREDENKEEGDGGVKNMGRKDKEQERGGR